MTTADRIREVLAAHGVDPGTCSLNGTRTLLGEELERLVAECITDAQAIGWHEGVFFRRNMERVEAVEGQLDLTNWCAFHDIANALRRYTWAAIRAALTELEKAGRAESRPGDEWRAVLPKPIAGPEGPLP